MEHSVVCVQILRFWRTGGVAVVGIVPGEHFSQEDPAVAVAQKITNLQLARPAPQSRAVPESLGGLRFPSRAGQ